MICTESLKCILRRNCCLGPSVFPDEFYEQIFRLKGWPYPPQIVEETQNHWKNHRPVGLQKAPGWRSGGSQREKSSRIQGWFAKRSAITNYCRKRLGIRISKSKFSPLPPCFASLAIGMNSSSFLTEVTLILRTRAGFH